ncbi:MAG: phosphotransferase family protein [Actinomycetota bacterium]
MVLPHGISDRVEGWLVSRIPGATAPFSYTQIAGGHSNLTFRVDDAAGHSYVLRRPPLGHRLASAHDMGREHRIIAALADSPVPVAPALGFCDDESVNELPFYVMSFVDGHVVRDKQTAETVLGPAGCRRASESIVDTMAAIHAVDISAVGLADLGRHEGYLARQLKRWHGNIVEQRTRDLPLVDSVYEGLMSRIPVQGPATLVHGDYRLDNCMVDASGTVIAVLDWEICTLGDPMADLGLLMVYWTGPGDEASAWTNPVCTAEGFMNRADLAARYADKSGRDISHLPFYVSFAYWKLACIIEGVYARYLGGALGERDPAELDHFKIQVEGACQKAADALDTLG